MAFANTLENNHLDISIAERFTIFEVTEFMAIVEPHAADLKGLSVRFEDDVKVDTASVQALAMLDQWLVSKGEAIQISGKTDGLSSILSLFNLNLSDMSAREPE